MPGECGSFLGGLCAKITGIITSSFVPAGHGLIAETLPSVSPHSAGLLAGIFGRKVCLCYSTGVGSVVTDD